MAAMQAIRALCCGSAMNRLARRRCRALLAAAAAGALPPCYLIYMTLASAASSKGWKMHVLACRY